MKNEDNRRFRKGSGVYKCVYCGTKTRETGENESDYNLCAACLDKTNKENFISDNCLDLDWENLREGYKLYNLKEKEPTKSEVIEWIKSMPFN